MTLFEGALSELLAKLDRIEARLGQLEAWARIHNETLAPLIDRLATVEESVDELLMVLVEPLDAGAADGLPRTAAVDDPQRPSC
jgi:hypothetical protein